jgi:Glycosyl hydrolase family 99
VNGAHVSYHPALGYYSSSDPAVVDRHVAALNYANVDVAIASWFGPGSQSEASRIPLLLSRTAGPLRWALYYECEGNPPAGSSCQSGGPDPSAAAIESDLAYASAYAGSPAYMRVNGRPLIFVYSAGDSCAVADRWKQAAPGWHVVLKLFSGYKQCASQPDGWHQYGPASSTHHHAGSSYVISPGFRRADGAGSVLGRDLGRWSQQVEAMVASGEPWQLVTTFNEWGEGTAVESASEWSSASGHGQYLDALHRSDGGGAASPPSGATSQSPAVRALSVKPKRFRAARRGAGTAAGVGSRVRYSLSAPAKVRFRVQRALRVRKRTRFKTLAGRIEHNGVTGSNSFRFRGRIRGRALRRGRYRLLAVPFDASARAGGSRRAGFRIVSRSRRS